MLKTIFLKITVIALIICTLFTACSEKNTLSVSSDEVILPENAGSAYHTQSNEAEKICSSEYLQMFIDKKTFSIKVNDKNNNFDWCSLPKKSNSSAYAFAVILYTENGIYKLNTQDNSVNFGTASYEKTENGVKVDYVLSDKKETAEKSYDLLTKNDIYVSFSVFYTLYEQSMTVSVDCSSIKASPDSIISQISFLEYFGSSHEDSITDYFFIPDGSGAVMNLGKNDAYTDSVRVSVYGNDPYISDGSDTATATIPVFGIKRNNNAFSAIITDGDAQAEIRANRRSADTPSTANAVFNITPVKKSDNGNNICTGTPYTGNIKIVYKFLADSDADYSGMARAAREEFINNDTLPAGSYKNNDDEIPFCISFVGEQDNRTLTTIGQAADISGILKAKGIDNIQLTFKGVLSGGFAQKNLYTSDILSSLGGANSYNELHDYTQMLNYTLLTDVNIFSSSKRYSGIASSNNADGEKATYSLKNDLSFRDYPQSRLSVRISNEIAASGFSKRNPDMYAQTESYTMYLTDMSRLKENISAFLSGKIFRSSDGVSVSDAGYILYSDKDNSRQKNMQTISSLLKALGRDCVLTVKGGNIYTLYSADHISDMEFDTFYSESEAYEPVPFAQSVIHSSLLYSGKPIDAGDPLYRYDMLQCIEYGAIPAFEWIYSTENIFCYDGYLLSERITEITEFYKKANNALYGVSSSEIINHRKITSNADGKTISGVYCTAYSDGTEIYVNYTGTPVVTPENIVVGAYDFVKITR